MAFGAALGQLANCNHMSHLNRIELFESIGWLNLGAIHTRFPQSYGSVAAGADEEAEEAMLKFKTLHLAVALSVCAAFAIPTAASAQKQKKISYEEAFRRCKAFMDKERGSLGAGTTSDANKATRGASCMKRFGHRL